LVSLLLMAAPAGADVPPGFDLFETDPEQTVFSFREEATIPANFFAPGSAPFQGDVAFGGEPILTFQGHDVGDADTVVEREQLTVLAPPFPADATGPINLRLLSLVGMQPIEVQVGNATQLWEIGATESPTRPSTGEIRILQSSASGGQFDSRLTVFPLFTFTRLSDGETRVLDVGATPQAQNPTFVEKITLTSSATPWRPGCIPPALAVPGVNDGFCPGQTPGGRTTLNREEAPLAKHGVVPASRRLEHFSCYVISPSRKFKRRTVKLRDQFGRSRARVLKHGPLCAPARKRKEPYRNKRAHLQCYEVKRLKGTFLRRLVAVRNQFGSLRLRLLKPSGLCLPTVKTRPKVRKPKRLRKTERIDHFACYRVRQASRFRARTVVTRDQFGRTKTKVLKAVELCAPVAKNSGRVLHRVRHLVCYRVKRSTKVKIVKKRVHNQFGHALVKVLRPGPFCVPSLKRKLEEAG
jgi:hypothetical protein